MKRSEITNSEIFKVLELRADGKSYDCILAEGGIHHRKQKIIESVKWFKNLDWSDARAFCGNDQHILALRDDYVERKIAEAKDYEETFADIQKLRLLVTGEGYVDEETDEIKQLEPIPLFSGDRLLVQLVRKRFHPELSPKLPFEVGSFGTYGEASYEDTKKKFMVHTPSGIGVDIFSTDVQCWAVALVARTGGDTTNKHIATAALRKGQRFRTSADGFDTPDGHITCSTEREVFEVVGLPYLPPEQRE